MSLSVKRPIYFGSLIKTEVVLKCFAFSYTDILHVFNKNRSCIEIHALIPTINSKTGLIKTEVVLK